VPPQGRRGTELAVARGQFEADARVCNRGFPRRPVTKHGHAGTEPGGGTLGAAFALLNDLGHVYDMRHAVAYVTSRTVPAEGVLGTTPTGPERGRAGG
jgi:hypothetical protein